MGSVRAVEKYCAHYAEAELGQLSDFPPDQCFQQVLVVPAYREEADFLAPLQTLAGDYRQTLVILVINQPDHDDNMTENLALLDAAKSSGDPVWQREQLTLVQWPMDCAVLLVDRFSPGLRIPRKQGVGLARKIGNDLAVELYRQGLLKAGLIHNSDADAKLPADYFLQHSDLQHNGLQNRGQQSPGAHSVSAFVYPFRHVSQDDPLGRATRLYEESLHYYVDGLRWAGSPYCFHTIGSCIAVSLEHYCLARGFPRRAGGEDFYLLNKLAKLAPVTSTEGQAIEIKARHSNRVPFGTGPAVEKILALANPENFPCYDPRVFQELKQFLEHLRRLQEPAETRNWLAVLPARLREVCLSLEIGQLLDHLAREARSDVQCQRHIHNWFDGFRTLKFIHSLQERYYPALPFSRVRILARQILE